MTPEPQELEFSVSRVSEGSQGLYVTEVAMKLRVTEQHVLDLIEEGKLQAINIGGNDRKFWRIPGEAYKAFLSANHSFRL